MAQWEVDEELVAEFGEIASDSGCELLETEYKGGVLRLTIDHPDGVTHDHCQNISRQISSLLDVSDFGNARYVLEVSSPGLNRKLYSPADYERYVGRLVRVTWKSPNMEHKKTVVGHLSSFSPTEREIDLQEQDSDTRYNISMNDIRIARLEPEL